MGGGCGSLSVLSVEQASSLPEATLAPASGSGNGAKKCSTAVASGCGRGSRGEHHPSALVKSEGGGAQRSCSIPRLVMWMLVRDVFRHPRSRCFASPGDAVARSIQNSIHLRPVPSTKLKIGVAATCRAGIIRSAPGPVHVASPAKVARPRSSSGSSPCSGIAIWFAGSAGGLRSAVQAGRGGEHRRRRVVHERVPSVGDHRADVTSRWAAPSSFRARLADRWSAGSRTRGAGRLPRGRVQRPLRLFPGPA